MSSSANLKPIFSKILVAIDSSDISMDAADYATVISQSRLQLNSFIRQNYMLYMLYMLMLIYTGQNMRNEGEKYLDKVKVKANEDIHIKTEIISSKDISGGILDFAEENNIDLIVIGTRGRSGFKRRCITCCNLCTLPSIGSKIIVTRGPEDWSYWFA